MNEILFHTSRQPYFEFSNFLRGYPINLDSKVWPTTEHYYQAQKFTCPILQEQVRNCGGPWDAAKMGRDPKNPLRPDWEQIKDDVMRKAIMAKFSQHDKLRKLLLSTEDAIIIEHSNKDSYWGDYNNGKNMLGKILMETREILKKIIS